MFFLSPLLVCANSEGIILLMDAENLEVLDSKVLVASEKEKISILKYSPEGKTLICGTSSGKIWFSSQHIILLLYITYNK